MLSDKTSMETKTRYGHSVGPVHGNSAQAHIGFYRDGKQKGEGHGLC